MPLDLSTIDRVIATQTQLTAIGLLDPPADGGWGPVSKWALAAWANDQNADPAHMTDQQIMSLLMNTSPRAIRLGNDFPSRIIRAMRDKNYFVNLHPDCVNVCYVEGVDPDGTPNDRPWNGSYDARCVVQIGDDGHPNLLGSWQATTQPGEYFTINPMNPDGAFHIALGQYKAWVKGWYHTREAWTQAGTIRGTRDPHCTRERDQRFPVEGDGFGVHHHSGYNMPRNDLENSSAGCLVGRMVQGHLEFMSFTKADARYQVNPAYRMMAAIITAADVEDNVSQA